MNSFEVSMLFSKVLFIGGLIGCGYKVETKQYASAAMCALLAISAAISGQVSLLLLFLSKRFPEIGQ